MARRIRIEYKDALYHIINSSISNHDVFQNEFDRKNFIELLEDINKVFQIKILAYVLMNKEYHLLLCTPAANLSDAMRYLNGVYTQRYNKKCNRNGPLFRGRYKSILINSEMYLLQVSRYIHWIPVKNKLCKSLEEFTWSSYAYYANRVKRSPKWLCRSQILNRYGDVNPERLYNVYLNDGIDDYINQFYERKHVGSFLGSNSFRKKIIDEHRRSEVISTVDSDKAMTKPVISELAEYIESCFLVENVYANNFSDKVKRNIVMAMCRDIGGYSLKELSTVFKLGHQHSASVLISRTRKIIVSNSDLNESYSVLQKKLRKEFC